MGAIVATMVVAGASASAQEQEFLQVGDILPGVCDPSPIVVGQQTDCRFPLARPVVLDPLGGPYVADVAGSYDDDNQDRPTCVIEDGELVCRGVPTYYPAGTTRVRVQVGWLGTTAYLAEIATLDYWQVPAVITPVGSTEPYATALRPLEIWIDRWESGELLAKVRHRDGGGEAGILPIPQIAGTYDPVLIDIGGLAPGRYRIQPCIPQIDDPADCEEVPGAGYFQVGSGELVEAIPDWNRAGADRINLVLAGTGFEDFDAFAEMAVAMLGFDGPTLLDFDGEVIGASGEVDAVEFGPFATEPLRSLRSRFNVWLLTDLIADDHALFWPDPPNGLGFGPDGGVLPDAQITVIELLPVGRWSGSEAGFPSFTGLTPGPPDRTDLQFASAYVALSQWNPLAETDTLTHELGHAVFDLRDEYTLYDRSTQLGYPNCAPDLETAEAWWGDLVGRVDPWLDEYVDVLESHGRFFGDREDLVQSLTIGYSWGGCYAGVGTSEAVRPTSDSIMNGQIPVFGSVNRRRVEEILGLWSGRDLVRSAEDLEVDCTRTEGDPWSVGCRGALVPYVDPSPNGLVIASGGKSGECRTTGGGDTPVAVACGPLLVSGYGETTVTVGDPAGTPATFLLPRIEVDAPGLPLGLGGVPQVRAQVPGQASPWIMPAVAAVGGSVLMAGAILLRRRKRPSEG